MGMHYALCNYIQSFQMLIVMMEASIFARCRLTYPCHVRVILFFIRMQRIIVQVVTPVKDEIGTNCPFCQ